MLGKITEILDAFSLSRPAMTLGEIQQATGLPTSTVQRLVSNMAAQGLLDRSGDQIRIGVRVAYWAATATKDLDELAVINPVLKEIRDKTGETACFFKAESRTGLRGHRGDAPCPAARHVRGPHHPAARRLGIQGAAGVARARWREAGIAGEGLGTFQGRRLRQIEDFRIQILD